MSSAVSRAKSAPRRARTPGPHASQEHGGHRRLAAAGWAGGEDTLLCAAATRSPTTPVRILHAISSLDPAHGGPPRIASRLAAGQAAVGCDVEVVSYRSPEAQTRIDADLAAIPVGADRVAWRFLGGPRLAERLLAREARRVLAERSRLADLVYVHNVWDPLSKAAADCARRARIPYAVLLNGMLDPWSLRQKALKKRVALALGYRRMLSEAAFLHVGNADERDLIAPLRLRAPASVIPNGVFLEEVEPLPPAGSFHAAHPELAGEPYVLFLARLHYKKGLNFLADAFALVAGTNPDVRLVVAGNDDGGRAQLERQVARLGIAGRVHLVGPLYATDKLAALAGAACFCLPSRQEGFSVAVTEALACGVPAVVSDACHFPEVAEVGAGRVVPLDPTAIAAAVREVLGLGADARQRMGRAGRDLVRARFTWPQIARQSIEAFRAVTTRRGDSAD